MKDSIANEMKMLKKYVEDLGEMLKKQDWKLVEPFIEEWKDFIGRSVVAKFKLAPENVKKLTYVRMVYGRTDMDTETIKYAMKLQVEVDDQKNGN